MPTLTFTTLDATPESAKAAFLFNDLEKETIKLFIAYVDKQITIKIADCRFAKILTIVKPTIAVAITAKTKKNPVENIFFFALLSFLFSEKRKTAVHTSIHKRTFRIRLLC